MHSEIKALLESSNAHPFLFVGSGFTHRYLETEDWKGLITHFAKQAKPGNEYAFNWYKNEVSQTSPNPDLPTITERIETDYARRCLEDAEFQEFRDKYATVIHDEVSPLKIGVAEHLGGLEETFKDPKYPDEISSIGHARKNVAGIITTNFDQFLEHLFPEHVPYIGQNQLLFNESFAVGEIYKIHGCVSEPGSLVLTRNDYDTYQRRNAYLSAKLMTIFLEHPIIFLGYSLSDQNIKMIFDDISQCLTPDQLSTLSSRLIFVQRAKEGRPEGVQNIHISLENGAIEATGVTLSDFSDLFKAIAALRSSYPPKILRKLKQDIYEMVRSTSPKSRIQVVGINESTKLEEIEYVMGVGVAADLSGKGYTGLDVEELTEDLLFEGNELEISQVVEVVLPKRGKQSSFNLPVFKYTSHVDSENLHESVSIYLAEVAEKGIDKWISTSMRHARKNKPEINSLQDLRSTHDASTSKGVQQLLHDLPFIPVDQIDLDEFKELLVEIWEKYDPLRNTENRTLTSWFRKAVRIYDWLKYGKEKAPEVPKGEEAN